MPRTRRQTAQNPSPLPSPVPSEQEPEPTARSSSIASSDDAHTSPSRSPSPDRVSKQVKNARQPNWRAWQDRALIEEALSLKPFLESKGAPIQEAWDTLADTMHRHTAQNGGTSIDRTGAACRARFKVIMDAHKRNEARSLQDTGTNEDVNEHIMRLTTIAALIKDHEDEKERKAASAKSRTSAETKAALELRDAAMKGTVKRDTLTDIAELPGSTVRERQGQRRKRARSPSMNDSEKENMDGDCGDQRPRKVRRSVNSILRDSLEQRAKSDNIALEAARARDETRQVQLVDRLDRMTEGITALTELTRQKMEQDREQNDTMKIILGAVLKK
ncbi:hypothetical protein DFP72DRAFT_1179447 [Ephemerocybe angulata]|uniref:Myb-like domain-containing protein n=1 Tax=Ephemerocybe angulata TaxID=980116 RepID=A0A8H6LU21_9AGAR|nr:hypothetical protein DFP72DRAFT_1179447 [Tulosesus angulatus]